ncbi:MAG: hypothetical protein QMC95_18345 [Desulfitobacteriaceae bacterium]|nr:hypothetical protein [Desulfitobacteriaceae bacterium]MDI6916135.1 hypothetical protein [Desulfitobacteriaceae bacterium]
MEGLVLIMFLSVLLEKIMQLFKDIVSVIPFFPDKFQPITLELLSLASGIILAYGTGLNAFEIFNVKFSFPQVGMIMTGMVIGKGANFAHDFFTVYAKPKQR